ncbi:hypothetical protein N7462_003528 [Penicillium macrosclerotiorum]|uniref:uncharacterized protein n=1 Tax=Penicillium macrosclerotiorum TaxID=303699 RepID=UPI00254942A5|nr:uncharacterized protein N7462_003528 [Penicillium macrosclerotiorum]KAJ5689136.1 hypothetical protein N7462_003528 [Penicillium macrosclerotiorum]
MDNLAPDIRSELASKKWFGFDLDDTLHDFRKATGQASLTVFEAIHDQYAIDIDVLEASYQGILQKSTANAFTDGKTSTEYRRDRISHLLQTHGIDSDIQIDNFLDIYKSSLERNLNLKAGILDILDKLQQLNKKVIVVTEGPADAQEWTIQKLGLQPYVDILVTTNEIGKSKVDGIFQVILDKYGIKRSDIVFLGDNAVRDVQAAQKESILAILYDEGQESQLDDLNYLRIKSWEILHGILENSE